MALQIRKTWFLYKPNSFTSLIWGWRGQERTSDPSNPSNPSAQCGAGGSQPCLKEKVKRLINNGFLIVEEGCKLLGGCLGSFCRRRFWKLIGIREGKPCLCVVTCFPDGWLILLVCGPNLLLSLWESEPLSLDSAPAKVKASWNACFPTPYLILILFCFSQALLLLFSWQTLNALDFSLSFPFHPHEILKTSKPKCKLCNYLSRKPNNVSYH